MGKVSFKKVVNNTIYLSDNRNKYELVHPYFSFSDNEMPYDSNIFRQCLEAKQIVVVEIDGTFKLDFEKYLEHDEYLVEQKKEDTKINEEAIKVRNKEEAKQTKILEKELTKKKKIEEKKKKLADKVEVISDEDILKKL